MTWLVLVDQDRDLSNADTPHKVMSTRDYLSRPQLFGGQEPEIINLWRSYGYQGAGYHCSLFTESRGKTRISSISGVPTAIRAPTITARSWPRRGATASSRPSRPSPNCRARRS